jgi:hypothetical protein
MKRIGMNDRGKERKDGRKEGWMNGLVEGRE